MANEGMDPSLLQDFLTESAELIEQLDADLVILERAAETPEAADLLNKIFRALHTIKGAASFLGLTEVTTFSHAAEDALNRLRKGEAKVTAEVMDALLKSVDIVRGMIQSLAAGEPVQPGPQPLIDQLHAIAEGRAASTTASDSIPSSSADSALPTEPAAGNQPTTLTDPDGTQRHTLELPGNKADLLEFMASDLKEQTSRLRQALTEAHSTAGRSDAAATLGETAQELARTAEFFELADMTKLVGLIQRAAPALAQLPDALAEELLVRLQAINDLLDQQAAALDQKQRLAWPLNTLHDRVQQLTAGQPLADDIAGKHGKDPKQVLILDRVLALPSAAAEVQPTASRTEETQPVHGESAATPGNKEKEKPAEAAHQAANVEQTVRVEVGRLEALLNLVGQLVLTKNRFLAMGRRMRDHDLPTQVLEDINGACGDLDRLTSELQVGVMRTRMQPLGKLFDRYPRVIRDLARMTDKKINLQIVGKETEVDKSVLELLADPLVHILRNSADHGIEIPGKRTACGKKEVGTIRLSAEHQGSHVRVEIQDDGKGLDREILGQKAIEKGLTTPEQLATMPDSEVFRFIFAAGFSTAEKVTDLSGRGVGMDVVRTNISKLNGAVNIFSTKGQGTTIEILIPLTVAIMPAMVVGVGKHLYCIPLQTIFEIIRPETSAVHTVAGQPVMRLRDSVLPLLDLRSKLSETGSADQSKFAVIVGVGAQRAGLMVDRLIGQQEIVIKPLDDAYTTGGPFSGATIREDGDVSLILDVVQLIRQAQVSSGPVRNAA